jgi:HlyD family secretion protein
MPNNTNKKLKKKIFIFGGLGLLLIILITVAIASASKEEIILVTTEKVERRTLTQKVAATGKIQPEFKVVITPEVTGEIVELPVKEGDRVKKGQLLIRIKGDQYKAQKERLEANLQSAKSNLKIRDAELRRIESELRRVKELHDKNLVSDAELEIIQTNYLSAKASYESAVAMITQSEAQLREVLEMLYKTTIYSPLDGIVTNLKVEVGERVLGSNFTQGTELMTVADLNNMEAVVDVDENDVVLVSIGDTAEIKVDAIRDKIIKGIVTQIGNSAKTKGFGTQEEVVNFEVRIKLIDLDERLRPGMSCTADISTETVENVLSVPIQSVTARIDIKDDKENETLADNKNYSNLKEPDEIVFIVENLVAKAVKVKTGISDDNYIEIKSGLNGGEVVISGSYKAISNDLKDGSKVRVEQKKKDDRNKN